MNISHILLPYKGSSSEEELLRVVSRIARAFKARISVVHIIEVPMALPLDAENLPGVNEANAVLVKAEGIARSAGARVDTDVLRARDAAHAIVEEAVRRNVDLIFMEASERTRLGTITLGRTVEYVLKKAPIPVFISRLTIQT